MATISGTVKDSSGSFAARLVRAYRRSDGALAGQAVSNATTGEYSITTLDDTAHFAVVHDGAAVEGDPHWGNVVLAMHMDGANNATTFTDIKGNAITAYGTPVTKTTQVDPFGAATGVGYFDGASALRTGPNASLAMGTGDFTAESWVYLTSLAAQSSLFGDILWTGGYIGGWVVEVGSNGALQIIYNGTGSSWTTISSSAGLFTANVWHHVATSRQEGVQKLFLDGIQVASVANTKDYTTGRTFRIGERWVDGASYYRPKGYIDDLRITKGVARYISDFTPPTSAFPHAPSVGSPTENALILDNITPL